MDYRKIIAHLRQRIIDQDEAINKIEEALAIAQAKLNEPDKPLCVLLFLGPTGVGKTETVKALSEAIHGSADAYCRVDMGTLSEPHYAASLSGSPPGYVGSQEGDTLLDKKKIEGQPDKPGILLLDEVEKAHPLVHQTLLQIFDNARLKLSNGKAEVSFSNTIIVMTSNVGSGALKHLVDQRQIGFRQQGSKESDQQDQKEKDVQRTKVAMEALDRSFRPEFLNRIDSVIVFRWLNEDDLLKILAVLVNDLNTRLMEHHQVAVELDGDAQKFLTAKGFDPKYGARPLKRAMRQYLQQPLARLIVISDAPKNSKIMVSVSDDQLSFDVQAQALSVVRPSRPRYVDKRFQVPHPHSGVPLYPYPNRFMRPYIKV